METSSDLRAKKAAAAISQLRKHDQEFITKDFIDQLRQNGCPYPQIIPKILKEQKLITRTQGFITFVNDEPIFFGLLKAGLNKAGVAAAQYNVKFKTKQMGLIELNCEKAKPMLIALNDPKDLSYIDTNLLIEELKTRGDYKVQLTITQIIDC